MQDGLLAELKGDKLSIGGKHRKGQANFEEQRVGLEGKPWLYLSTDGYRDQFGGPDKKKFGPKAFRELLLELPGGADPDEREQRLAQCIEHWQQAGSEKQIDDITVFGCLL